MKTLKELTNGFFVSKQIQQTPYYLIALLTFNMIVVVTITVSILYHLGFERQKMRLIELVETQAQMINVVANQEFLHHPNISGKDKAALAENVIRKVANAHYQYGGFGKTGEFTLGKRQGDKIKFLIKQRHFNLDQPTPIPWKSYLGEPMRRALKGEKGVDVTYDYRGAIVLAAYEPIPNLEWGIVAKVDLSEIRAPYITASLYAFAITVFLALIGSVLFWYFLNPLVQNIEDARYFNRLLIASSPIGLVLCTSDGRFIDANKSFLSIIDFDEDQLHMFNYFDLIADELREHEKMVVNGIRKTQIIDPHECIFINKYKERIDVRISGRHIILQGEPYVWLSVDNISDYKKREAELLLSDAVFHNTSEIIFVTDASKNIIKVNEAFNTVTGYSFDEVKGKNPRIFKSGKHDDAFYQEIYRSVGETGKWHGEIWNRRKNGEIYPSLQSISAMINEEGQLLGYIAVLSDISIQKAYEEKLLLDSQHDALTGLPNRLYFNRTFSRMFSQAEPIEPILALFFIELNQFKEINDTHGHECGDILLKTVAARLRENVRSNDFVARLGGDEFTIILQSLKTREEAISIAKKLIQKAKEPLFIENCTIHPSISIGIAF